MVAFLYLLKRKKCNNCKDKYPDTRCENAEDGQRVKIAEHIRQLQKPEQLTEEEENTDQVPLNMVIPD